MKKISVIMGFSLLLAFLATAAWAGPKDKAQGALVSDDTCTGFAPWRNGAVKGKWKIDSKKIQIQFKGIDFEGGDPDPDVVCGVCGELLRGSDEAGDNAVDYCEVLGGQIDKGKLKLKADRRNLVGSSLEDSVFSDLSVGCYRVQGEDYDLESDCDDEGSVFIPVDESAKPDSLLGACINNGSVPSNVEGDSLGVNGIGHFPKGCAEDPECSECTEPL